MREIKSDLTPALPSPLRPPRPFRLSKHGTRTVAADQHSRRATNRVCRLGRARFLRQSFSRPRLLAARVLAADHGPPQIYTPFAPASSRATRDKKQEILQLRTELAATSSQDEFSKWARIRRKLDKAVAELEQVQQGTSQHRQQFAKRFKSLLWLATTVIPFVISSYHRKTPVVWLPRGWFGPLAWWLSFPSAPAGNSRLLRLSHAVQSTHPQCC